MDGAGGSTPHGHGNRRFDSYEVGLLLSTVATGRVVYTDTGSTSDEVLVYGLSLCG